MTPEERWAAFGERLSQLREAAGMSGVRLAKLVGWPASKTSKMQRAQQRITEQDVRTWCEAVGADGATTEELLAELRAIRLDEARSMVRLRTGHQPIQKEIGVTERNASTIRAVTVNIVPGLLQTPDYARAVFTALATAKGVPDDAEAAVAARMQRQTVLYDSGKRIELLVTESALRLRFAPSEVMAGQYDRLLSLIGMRTLRFGIVPLDSELPLPLLHGWTIVDDEARIEALHTSISTREPDDVAYYNRITDQLWAAAAEGDDARAILTRLLGRETS